MTSLPQTRVLRRPVLSQPHCAATVRAISAAAGCQSAPLEIYSLGEHTKRSRASRWPLVQVCDPQCSARCHARFPIEPVASARCTPAQTALTRDPSSPSPSRVPWLALHAESTDSDRPINFRMSDTITITVAAEAHESIDLGHDTRSPGHTTAILSAIDAYSLSCDQRCAAVAVDPTLSATRALGVRSLSPRSSVPAGPRSALERVYASPPFPTGVSSVAAPSASPLPSSLARRRYTSVRCCAQHASRRATPMWAVSHACRIGRDRHAASVCAVRRVVPRARELPMRTRRGASVGVRHVACGGRGGERGRAPCDRA